MPLDATWPTRVDMAAIAAFGIVTVAAPLLGYWLTVIDIRRYLRALRGALVRVVTHFPEIPGWARQETPACLRALGLRLPCTVNDVKRAYRQRAEELHPDRGGDRQRFHRLHRHFLDALEFLNPPAD